MPMKNGKLNLIHRWLLALSLLIVTLLHTSCGNPEIKKHRDPVPNVSQVVTPLFLNRDLALLFTNIAGFTAKVEVDRPADAVPSQPAHLSGELLGRNGSLLFILERTDGRWEAKEISRWGLTFLWNQAEKAGFVLNEPLQGYAPIRPAFEPMPHYELTALGNETVNNTLCAKSRLSYQSVPGAIISYTLWRSPDLKDFPVKIQATDGHSITTWTFSKIQYVKLRSDALEIPAGFTRYESNETMLDEITRRESQAERGALRSLREYYERNPYGEGRPKEPGR